MKTLSAILFIFSCYEVFHVKGMSSGPPTCTLIPSHAGASADKQDWRDLFDISFTRCNQGQILDPRNKTQKVDPNPDGWFVVIEPKENTNKPEQISIKGFALRAMNEEGSIEFPLIHRNHRLKKLDCYGGELMLSHRNAEKKSRISFYFKGHLDYLNENKKLFRATILSSYMKFWSGIKF